jgi:histidyl-tRNA synthetase
MKDLLPPETFLWIRVEGIIRNHFLTRGYLEIRTPVLEKSELFIRSIGETTDIVEKEMYTFADKSGDLVTMRPEGTAPVVRAYVENRGFFKETPVRLFYLGPMFRHERPQKGRLRQFHQAGAEILGSEEPYVDAEVLITLYDLFGDLNLKNLSLEVNSLGCPSCRPRYNGELLKYTRGILSDLCDDCRRRYERNPLRVLDCKSAKCIELTQGAPAAVDYLCGKCRDHFNEVMRILSANSVSHSVNSRMVRGLDYYQKTTFEFLSGSLGAQNAVAAGGRYDGLAEMIGSRDRVPGVGFAIGIERLIMLLGPKYESVIVHEAPKLFIAQQTPDYRDEAFFLKRSFEEAGLFCEMDYEGKSLKSQMRKANRINAGFVLIIGEAEMDKGLVRLKDMVSGDEETISRKEVIKAVVDKVK